MPDKQIKLVDEEGFNKRHWADQYHISERTLSRAIADGKLKCLRFGRAVRITPEQFAAYIEGLGE